MKITKKIKLAHLVNVIGPAGKEKKLLDYVRHMDHAKFNIDIIVFSKIKHKGFVDLQNINVILLDKKPGKTFSLIIRLIKVLRKNKYDIIYTHSWNTLVEGFIGAVVAHIPVKIHGEHGTFERSFTKNILQKFLWKRFKSVTVVSKDLEYKMRTSFNYKKDNMGVLYNGIDDTIFYPSQKFNQSFREKYSLKDKFVVGTIGRFHPVKDHFTLIRAFHLFNRIHPDSVLILLGHKENSPSLKSNYEALIKELDITDSVLIMSLTAEPEKVINALDVFVLSSISEGCSNVILESYACAVPVVASRTGGNPELVKQNINGLLFEVGDPNDLKTQLLTLYDNPKKKDTFSQMGYKIVKENFIISQTVLNYEMLYDRLYADYLSEK